MKSRTKTIAGIAALSGLALGGATVAGAVSGNNQSAARHQGETALTGDTASRVRAAALAKTGGGTVERVETDADGHAPYEAHIVKADGTRVTVYVDKAFNVVGVESGPAGRPRGNENALTGDTASRVRAAALAKTGGGTVERVETDADGHAPYEAHIVKADGTHVTVYVDKQFDVVGTDTGP